jgi:hypothetical protein
VNIAKLPDLIKPTELVRGPHSPQSERHPMLAGKATDFFDPFNNARDFTRPSKRPPKSCLTSVKKRWPFCSHGQDRRRDALVRHPLRD